MRAKHLIQHFAGVLASLQDRNIPFIITGTVSINLHGIETEREPEDLDITTTSDFDFESIGFENIWNNDDYPENVLEDINRAIWQKKVAGEKINILVLQVGKALNQPIIAYRQFPLDPLGECLKWKTMLCRNKDIKDLDFIKQKYFK